MDNNTSNPETTFPGTFRPEAPDVLSDPYMPNTEEVVEAGTDLPEAQSSDYVVPVDQVTQAEAVSQQPEAKTNWKKTAVWAIAGAAAVASVVATAANTEFAKLKEQVVDIAPWAGAGLVVSEGLFLIGGAMVLAAFGKKTRNFLSVRKEVATMQQDALSNKTSGQERLLDDTLFKTGFAINAVGALGTAGVAIAAAAKLPHESWGLMTPAFIDIWATLTLRGAVWKALKFGKGKDA